MKWMPLFVVTLLATASVLLLSGCGTSCKPIGRTCELAVALNHARWEPGTYVFEAEGGGKVDSCTVTLPLESDEIGLPCLKSVWSGSESSMKDGYPTRLVVSEPPKKVSIRITYEGTVVASQNFKPSYEETEPNGEGCGICRNAEVTMEY